MFEYVKVLCQAAVSQYTALRCQVYCLLKPLSASLM